MAGNQKWSCIAHENEQRKNNADRSAPVEHIGRVVPQDAKGEYREIDSYYAKKYSEEAVKVYIVYCCIEIRCHALFGFLNPLLGY